MFHRTLVDATDLHRWADRLEARSRLAELLRRLIHATPAVVERIGFPAGEGIQQSGWDGVLVAGSTSPFVPDGHSVWELGVNSRVKAKADQDYRKRTEEPRGLKPGETIYVFITPRRWSGKDDWVTERQAERIWKEVRAYDADDLEHWLQQTPAVHLWLSIITGKHPQTAVDLESYWVEWSEVTRPPLSPSLLTSGREEALERLYAWLQSPASTLAIKADSRDEAVALLAAVIQQLPDDERLSFFSRAIVVDDQPSWHHLVASDARLILIPTFNITKGTTRATRGGHHVLIPRGRDDSSSDTIVTLPRIRRAHARNVFLAMGLPEDRADDLALLARRSLMALRRRLAVNEELQQPAWAKPAEARQILPALLAGGWSDVQPGDREIIARLARQEYIQVNATLVRWANEPDPPVHRVGNTWILSAKEDAWPLLARFLSRDDLELFETVVLDVLGAPDLQFDLPIEQRLVAGILGKAPAYSGLLRTGLADTLALLGAYSDTVQLVDAVSGQERANRIVHILLTRGNEDWRIWASLSGFLPRLAEAAPSEFLSRAERALLTEPPVLLKLFEDSQSPPLFSSSAHTGLLWALELLAWHRDFLVRAALVLARLAACDPGGKLMNRPANSLREIFLCWHPQTMATLQHRFNVLDLIRQREPRVAWGVLCQILPKTYSFAHRTSSPQWRDWIPDPQATISYVELFEAAEGVVVRLLLDVGDDPHRWKALIELTDAVPQQAQKMIIQRLMQSEIATFCLETRLTIRETLRSLVSKHRAFPEAGWVLPNDVLDQLDTLRERYEPENPVEQYAWLFSNSSRLVTPFGHDWEAQPQAVSEARLQAAELIYAQEGMNALLEFATKVEQPGELGRTLGMSELLAAEEDSFLLQQVRSDTPAHRILAQAYVLTRGSTRGWDWIEEKVANVVRGQLSSAQQAEFFQFLPFAHRSWELLASFEAGTQRIYWTEIEPQGLLVGDLEEAVAHLLRHERTYAAFYVTVSRLRDMQPGLYAELVADVLERFILEPSDPKINPHSLGYHISSTLAYIEVSGFVSEERIARLEWLCLPALEHEERGPRILHREMARNPQFFVDLLTFVYRAASEESKELTPDEQLRNHRAYDVIRIWRGMPGRREDGSIDVDVLEGWIKKVRAAAREVDWLTVADHNIGEVLARSPEDLDGSWPSAAVRDIIEAMGNEDLENSFLLHVFNSRGVSIKSIGEGGAQERDLAAKYRGYADLARARWPRTTAMLERIAEQYLAQAREADHWAELEEDLLL